MFVKCHLLPQPKSHHLLLLRRRCPSTFLVPHSPIFSVLDNLSFRSLPIPSPAWYNTSSPATHLNYPAKHHTHCSPIVTQFHSQQNHPPPATLCDTDTVAEILPTSLDSLNSPIAPNTQPASAPTFQTQYTSSTASQTQLASTNPHQTQPTSTTASQNTISLDTAVLNMSLEKLVRLKRSSASRQNFAAKVVRLFFTEEERARSNVRGKGSKRCLNPVKIDFVRQITCFHLMQGKKRRRHG